MELSLHVSLSLIPFEKRDIDYVGGGGGRTFSIIRRNGVYHCCHGTPQEAKAIRMDDAKNVAASFYDNIVICFGFPKILVSDRGTHFLNGTIKEMTKRF